MKRILLSAPNISEGRNLEIVNKVADEIRKNKNVKLIDQSFDGDHNRSVLTYIGEPEHVLEASKAMAQKAFELIDMAKHKGGHPRIGAVDVVPFVPVRDVKKKEAIEIARKFGKHVGGLGVPVYYYEEAATKPERESLPDIRKGEYEGLADKLKDPAWKPDEGPATFNAKSGALVTGVRFPLVAFNVNLNTTDLAIADRIAKSVRFISGGFRYVRAIGLALEKERMVQVSMNLINYEKTPIYRVVDAIRTEAARYGVSIAKTELIGPVPMAAVVDCFKNTLQIHDFVPEQIIENGLLE